MLFVDGEDIIDSDDDMGADDNGEPDELVYDELFVPDDYDSFRKNTATVAKSVAGPRFICSSPISHDVNQMAKLEAVVTIDTKRMLTSCLAVSADGSIVNCSDSDKDVVRLLQYFTVTYPTSVVELPPLPSSVVMESDIPATTSVELAEFDKSKSLSVDQV